MKLLHISDCHFGLQYAVVKDVEARNKIMGARLTALENAVRIANEEACDAIVIAGDLFENLTVTQKLIRQVCVVLNEFSHGMVWVLPGNHDYYDPEETQLWDTFEETAGDNIFLFTENRVEERRIRGEKVRFYPCICHDKHASENALGWVKEETMDPSYLNIGIAHGSLEGLSFDKEGSYYAMRAEELNEIPVDVWLLGHAHVPEPECPYDTEIRNTKIYNAGTHQQTNVRNRSEGSVFVLDIAEDKSIKAKRVKTGVLDFVELECAMIPSESLEKKIKSLLLKMDTAHTVLRLTVNGTVCAEDFARRNEIQEILIKEVLYLDKLILNVTREITPEMIDEETVVGSTENLLLKKYVQEPRILAAAYDLVMSCKES